MKADTSSYVHLQKLYKARAEEEKEIFKSFLQDAPMDISDTAIDEFVKNAHGIKILRGSQWGSLDRVPAALGD